MSVFSFHLQNLEEFRVWMAEKGTSSYNKKVLVSQCGGGGAPPQPSGGGFAGVLGFFFSKSVENYSRPVTSWVKIQPMVLHKRLETPVKGVTPSRRDRPRRPERVCLCATHT